MARATCETASLLFNQQCLKAHVVLSYLNHLHTYSVLDIFYVQKSMKMCFAHFHFYYLS